MGSVRRSLLVAILAAFLAVSAIGPADGSARVFDEPIASVVTPQRLVALTFDDGPDRRRTPEILAILHREHVHATFFVLGPSVLHNRTLVHREAEWHNEVGCHGWLHVDEMRYRTAEVVHAFRDCAGSVERITHSRVHVVRAPYGLFSASQVRALGRAGLTAVDWNLSGAGIASYPAVIGPDLMAITPGTIILLHDGRSNHGDVVRYLPRIIHRLRAEHFGMVTLDELFRNGTPVRESASALCDRERLYAADHFIRARPLTRRGCRVFS